MEHKRIKELISPYLDGALDDEARKTVDEHLASCPECRKECEETKKLEEVMNKMTFKTPSREVWDVYWTSVYNRLERGIGWIFFSLGAIILLFFGAYKLIEGLIQDPTIPLLLKAGIVLALGGVVVLLVSIIREHLFLRKKERYKEIDT